MSILNGVTLGALAFWLLSFCALIGYRNNHDMADLFSILTLTYGAMFIIAGWIHIAVEIIKWRRNHA